jgi:hypothetical protein
LRPASQQQQASSLLDPAGGDEEERVLLSLPPPPNRPTANGVSDAAFFRRLDDDHVLGDEERDVLLEEMQRGEGVERGSLDYCRLDDFLESPFYSFWAGFIRLRPTDQQQAADVGDADAADSE